jgi:hypothetical protein
VTPTDRLSGFGTGLATNSDSFERVPRGHLSQYTLSTVLHARLFTVARLLCSCLEPVSILLRKWLISGRSSVEGRPRCQQGLLDEVTIFGFEAPEADSFQGSYQLR